MADGVVHEEGRIEGDLGEWLSLKVWDEPWALRLGSDSFKPLYAKEAEELGYEEDNPVILLRRQSDDVVFEVDIDVTARKTSHTLHAKRG